MSDTLRLAMAQANFLVGDIAGNAEKIIQLSWQAKNEHHADIVIFPELALTGYPPEDLLFRPALYDQVNLALEKILKNTTEIDVILGYPEKHDDYTYNSAAYIQQGKIITHYHKQHLPNYSVFDEKRYFRPGEHQPCLFNLKGMPTALTICEDMWYQDPMIAASQAGAKLMICINASPFANSKDELRKMVMTQRAKEGHMPVIYVNTVGGQDELVFDGGSIVIDKFGELKQQAPFFKESVSIVDIDTDTLEIKTAQPIETPSPEELVYNALVTGVRDYIEKNHFPGALIGLSGGIDSALTLAIASDAIGADRVEAVMMPSRFTSSMSLEDAKKEADTLGVGYSVISIKPIYDAFIQSLSDEFKNHKKDTTEENLQARVRGTLLMAISNKKGHIVLATGNKSEMAVGYATLYGDMVGGFCVLKDVHKTLVYRLAEYRNSLSPVIPQRVIERAPSAELADDQLDQDSLPPYNILDEILQRYIEQDQSAEKIINAGFAADTVNKVINMVTRNEYKRRQAAPGVRISERAFGRDRRYPITSGY